tara:strand:+ start:297 stop:1679 length:1383 start_codon:yes stop_codon:yes gene_type:complete
MALTKAHNRMIAGSTVSPFDYGAVGDGVTDDSAAFNAAFLNGNKTIYVPEGTYLFDSYVRVYANTTVVHSPGAEMVVNIGNNRLYVNGPIDGSDYASGWLGDGSLSFEGGQYSCKASTRTANQVSYFKIGHARNVNIRDMKFKENWNGHYIELNAVQNGSVRDCVFLGQVIDAQTGRDAINIDRADASSFPEFGAFDNTTCDNITIDGCLFDGIQTMGTHNATGGHTNINISNNTFRNVTGQGAVLGSGWTGGRIVGNRFTTLVSKAIELDTCTSILVQGNYVEDVGTSGGTHAIQLDTCNYCNVSDNTVLNTGTSDYDYGYRSFNTTYTNVFNTVGVLAGNTGVIDADDKDMIDGSFRLNINADAAKTVIPPYDNQGFVRFVTRSGTNSTVQGQYFYRTAAEEMELIATRTGSTEETGTGVLTGTTGTSGKMTVSCATDGLIYVENRTGSSKTVWVTFN